MQEISTTAIIGMGALGVLYADQIVSALGPARVHFIADQERVRRYQKTACTVNGAPRRFTIVDGALAQPADLVIVAVKSPALEAALTVMQRSVGPDTTIISVMNGISSEAILAQRFGAPKVLYAIAQGMDAVKLGDDLRFTRFGELRLGVGAPEQNKRLQGLTRYLERAKIPYVVDADILHRLWGKFMLNVGINQSCLVYETTYSGALAPGEARETMIGAMREVMALAQLEGIELTEADLAGYLNLLESLSPDGIPSMRQDGMVRRPSEVDIFAGTVRRMAAKHHLPTPINDRLYTAIKEREARY